MTTQVEDMRRRGNARCFRADNDDNGLTLKHEEIWKSDLGEDRPVVVAAVAGRRVRSGHVLSFHPPFQQI